MPATNQNKVYIIISQWELKTKTSKLLEARETRMTALRKFSVLQLIGYAGVLDQSRRKIKQNSKQSLLTFDTKLKIALLTPWKKR